jgi:hypothetical protein
MAGVLVHVYWILILSVVCIHIGESFVLPKTQVGCLFIGPFTLAPTITADLRSFVFWSAVVLSGRRC